MLWINLIEVAIIAITDWWIWLYKQSSVVLQEGVVEVIVKDGVYQPSKIKIPANKESVLKFTRRDRSSCAETLLIPDLEINATLSLNKQESVTIPASPSGHYAFHCQMKMYVGELIIE